MRRVWLHLLTVLLTLPSAAQTPVVRAHLEPAKGILVGQPVRLIVSVFVPNYFTGSPDFPEFEIENAIVVLPQDRPQNSNEKINGITFAGITETYTIYPQQQGDFQLPPAEITVSYASIPPKNTEAHLALPALAFHADVPAAAKDLDYFLPTTQLTIQQKWSAPLKNLRAGDSVERTITVTATRMQAMLIPPLPLDTADGIRVYQDEPSVQDQKTDRGEFVFGRRTQSAKYFVQKEGDYTLPAIELKWWNLSTSRLVTATLPAVHFTAAANPNNVVEVPPEPEHVPLSQPKHVSLWTKYKFWIRVVVPFCIAVLFLLWLGWLSIPRIGLRLQTWQMGRRHSEPVYFRHLQRACKRNHASDAYTCLLKWLASAHPRATIQEFQSLATDSRLSYEIDRLGASLFGGSKGPTWNGEKFAHLLVQQRKTRVVNAPGERNLPRLNL